jgi:hypothetical protein
MKARVLIVGAGDAGRRLVLTLARHPGIGEIVLAGRRLSRVAPMARLAGACGQARVHPIELDALATSAVEQCLTRHRPDVIVQCGSLLSPWYLSSQTAPLAVALRRAGFALQLPAQLPILMSVMQAVRQSGSTAPVVNCSYPDVTHAILAPLGLAPTIGVGNVGMILGFVRAALQRDRDEPPRVRVLAHHGHVTPVVRADVGLLGDAPRPRVYLGEEGTRADALAFTGPPVESTQELNSLTAAHAADVIGALLPGASPLHTSAPGPLGLPGGYPVQLRRDTVTLDWPPGLAFTEAQTFHAESAALDGLAAIQANGCAVYTDAARALVAPLAPELAEPLVPAQALTRFARLAELLSLPT